LSMGVFDRILDTIGQMEGKAMIIFVVRHNGIERKFATVQERDALVDEIYASEGAYPVYGFIVQ
jgi:hypothetical protein